MTNIDPIEAVSPEQISKLPKWARDQIRRLERRNEEQAESLREMTGLRPGAIAVRDPYGLAAPVAWDRYDEVSFALTGEYQGTGRKHPTVSVRRREEGGLDISTPDGTLQIIAHSSNVVNVTVLDPLRSAR